MLAEVNVVTFDVLAGEFCLLLRIKSKERKRDDCHLLEEVCLAHCLFLDPRLRKDDISGMSGSLSS